MTRYWNSFEGQAEGAAVTTATSGTSGTAFSAVNTGTGAALTYTYFAQHGSGIGLRGTYADQAATGNVYLALAPASATTRVAARAYVSWTDTPSPTARAENLLAFRTASATVAFLNLSSSGLFQILDAASAVVATSPAPTIGTQYRVEFAAKPGTTTANGTIEVAVYVGDSSTVFWTFTTATANVGIAAITVLRIGRGAAAAARSVFFDDVAADDALASGWIGVASNLQIQATNSPPRIRLTIASPDGSAITAISVTRTDPSGSIPTRVQPPPGPSPLVLDDYEAPWDAAITYFASFTYANGAKTATFWSGFQILSPPAAWAIHPTTPALSVCIDQKTFSAMGVVSIGTETRQALATKHRIIGAEFQIVAKSGPRAAPSFSMQLALTSAADRAALVSLLRDQTPVLVQIPAAFGWDFDSGYYDVGDVGVERVLQYGPELKRTATLPLERVEAPLGTQAATWTWAGVLTATATFDAEKAAFATWTDVLTNTRK